MIYDFPMAFPDETLYSIIARYHYASGNFSIKATSIELFNRPHIWLSSCGGRYLSALAKNIQNGEGRVAKLIEENTLLSIDSLRQTTKNEKLKALFLTSEDGKFQQSEVKYQQNTVNSKLRYCPLCWKEDQERYHHRYWHRIHQIQGMDYCPTHRLKLGEIQYARYSLILADEIDDTVQHEFLGNTLPPCIEKSVFRIINDTSFGYPSYSDWMYAMYEKGMIVYYNPRVSVKKLLSTLRKLYGNEFEQFCNIHENDSDSKKQSAIRKILYGDYPSLFLYTFLRDFLGDTLHSHTKDFKQWYQKKLAARVRVQLRKGSNTMEAARLTGLTVGMVESIAKNNGLELNPETENRLITDYRFYGTMIPSERTALRRHYWNAIVAEGYETLEELRRQSPTGNNQYIWLLKYDKQWLLEHCPPTHKDVTMKKMLLLPPSLKQKEAASQLGISEKTYRTYKKSVLRDGID